MTTIKHNFKPNNRFSWTADERAEARAEAKRLGISYQELRSAVINLKDMSTAELESAVLESMNKPNRKEKEGDFEAYIEAESKATEGLSFEEREARHQKRMNDGE